MVIIKDKDKETNAWICTFKSIKEMLLATLGLLSLPAISKI